MMLFASSMILLANSGSNYKFIKEENGKYYLEEEDVIALANYIQQLEDLNKNYLEQIKTLEKMIATYEAEIAALKEQVQNLQNQLEEERARTWLTTATVIAAIALGSVILLFVKGG